MPTSRFKQESLGKVSFIYYLFQGKINLVISGLYSKHVPIVPVLVESWSGLVNFGSWWPSRASYKNINEKLSKCSTVLTSLHMYSNLFVTLTMLFSSQNLKFYFPVNNKN